MLSSFLSRRSFLSTASLAGASTFLGTHGAIAQLPMPLATDPASKKFDAFVASYMAAMNAPGLTLGITGKAQNLRTAGYGFANVDQKIAVTPDHLFQIGSITKSFVAVVILQLREEGKLDLHRSVLDYLPDLPMVAEFGPITVHHLLTHTSGLPDDQSAFAADPSARLLQGFRPGDHFHYCNAGFAILGLLARKLDGRSWGTLVAERIFKPLGMNASRGTLAIADRDRSATGYHPYWEDQAYPRHGKLTPAPILVMDDTAGCIASTPGDMARYLRMLLNHGAAPQGRVLAEESFALMATPYIKAEEFSPTASYGYGIAVDTLDGHKILRHTGGMIAFASSIHVDLDGGVAAFASINAMQGYRPTAVTEYAVQLARAQQESRPLPAAAPLADPMEIDNAADFAGTFTAPNGSKLTFAAAGKHLAFVDGSTSIPLQSAGGDAFLSTLPGNHALAAFAFTRASAPQQTPAPEARPSPVVEVAYGPDWYTRTGYAGPTTFVPPTDFTQFAGSYRSDSAWGGSTTVYILKDALLIEGTPLEPLGAARFRINTEPWSPDTVEFFRLFEGKMRVVRIAGLDYWRVDEA